MLNKMKIVLAGAAAVAAMSSTAAFAETENATATVLVIGAVDLTKVNDLDLGTVASSANSGSVVLPTSSNARVCTGGVTCVGSATRGLFRVTSASNGYLIAISHSPTVSLTGAGTPMNLTLASSVSSFTYNSATPQDIFIGGTLSVGVNQVSGLYQGPFSVTADYQ